MLLFSRWLLLLLLLFLVGPLISCASQNNVLSQPNPDVNVILVSHYWQEGHEEEVLQAAVDAFMRINPDVFVLLESSQRTGQDFQAQAAAGLGADMLIGMPYEEVIPLEQANLLQDLSGLEFDSSRYRTQYLQSVQSQTGQYALPFMAKTVVLYYNAGRTNSVPADLDELSERVSDDLPMGITTNFTDAFWGTQSFGASLFGEEGQVNMTLQGYVDWLTWLKDQREQPGMIFDNETVFLREKFISGEIVYLIDTTAALPQLQEAMGENVVGVAPLPAGDDGPASPLSSLEVIVFNRAAGVEKARVGLRLAEFLTNAAQQRKLVLEEIGRVPVNRRITIRAGLSRSGNALVRQGATSICIPLAHLPAFEALKSSGNEVYLEVLEGDVDPLEATMRFFEETNLPFE